MKIIVEALKKYKVILIAGILSALTVLSFVLMFSQSKESETVAKAGSQIEEMSQNIIKEYKMRPNYWGLSTAEVINKKLYAKGMGIKDGKLIGYFGGRVEIGADENGASVMPGSKNFVISYNELSKKQCIGLGGYKYDKKFWLNVSKIVIKNTNYQQDFVWGDEKYGLIPSKKVLKEICDREDNKVLVYF